MHRFELLSLDVQGDIRVAKTSRLSPHSSGRRREREDTPHLFEITRELVVQKNLIVNGLLKLWYNNDTSLELAANILDFFEKMLHFAVERAD